MTFTPQLQDPDAIIQSESKKPVVLLLAVDSSIGTLLNQFSSLDKILRIVSYCLRFSRVCQSNSPIAAVSAEEVSHSLCALIYYVQKVAFSDEISNLASGVPVSKNLRRLDLFIDRTGLIRVDGRLTNADISYEQKHPVLLPSKHRLTDLLIDHHHIRLKHPGAYALQAYLQQEYWIQSARRVIRSRLRLCMSCFRTSPKCIEPKMATLPKYRVQHIKSFLICGVDYAGPITIQ
jgi:hypothetical protein